MSENSKIIAIMPAGGWWISWRAGEEQEPLVGWGLTVDGRVVALYGSSNGIAEPVYGDAGDLDAAIFHPDNITADLTDLSAE